MIYAALFLLYRNMLYFVTSLLNAILLTIYTRK